MAFYFAALIHALVPVVLTATLWPVVFVGRRGAVPAVWGYAIGGVAGGLAVLIAILRPVETATGTILQAGTFAVACVAVMLAAATFLNRWRVASSRISAVFAPVLAAVLLAQGLFAAWSLTANHSMTVTDVVNTELIANCAAILLGFAFLLVLAMVLGRVARMAGNGPTSGILTAALVLTLVGGSGQLVLGLLRLDLVAVTAGRISYAAQLSLAEPWLVYADLGLVLGLAFVAFRRRFRMTDPREKVARRLQLAHVLGQSRWRNGLVGVVAFLLAGLAYQDLYASRPPTLSPATPVEANARGEVHIPVAQVKDGALHRFAFVTSSGHRVRFFLINRYDEVHADIGVVYDACMICGDAGYIQQGNEIICVACGVHMFRPSIGKPGGCNPIPLPHGVSEGAVVIAAADLEKGARYFPEVVTIEVTDPVTGQKLRNQDAPFQYEYGGRTYFFGGKESYERFRADPKSFLAAGRGAKT